MTETNPIEEIYDDEIDLSSFFAVLWKRRKLIIFGTLGVTLLSIGISLLMPKVYRSEAFYQLGNTSFKFIGENNPNKFPDTNNPKSIIVKQKIVGIPISKYKSSSSEFFNPNRLYIKASKEKSFGEAELKKLRKDLNSATDINKWIKPVYAFTKEDSRELSQLPQDESNSVLGLKLSYEADSPENAAAHVSFFGNYIRDCLLYVTLSNYIMDGYSSTASAMKNNENEIIDFQFKLLQYTNKMKDIRAILTNYPESAKIENRQLVSVQEGGDRFLAPVTQLVGIESTLADLRRNLAALQRDKEKLTVREEYFSRCSNELAKIGENGESFFLLIKSIKDEVFKNKDLSKDEVKEVFNNLSIDQQTFDFIFYKTSRFISEPTIPTEHFKPRKSLIVVVTFITSFLFFIVSAFILQWWQGNKKEIISNSSSSA